MPLFYELFVPHSLFQVPFHQIHIPYLNAAQLNVGLTLCIQHKLSDFVSYSTGYRTPSDSGATISPSTLIRLS